MNEALMDLNITLNLEEEGLPVLKGRAIIQIESLEEDEKVEIGFVSFNIYNVNTMDDFDEWIVLAEQVDNDDCYAIERFVQHLKENDFEPFELNNVLLIDRIQIDEKFRDQNYGTLALENLYKYAKLLNSSYLITYPAPIEKLKKGETRKNKIKKIIEFYKKCGFEFHKDSEMSDSIAYKKVRM